MHGAARMQTRPRSLPWLRDWRKYMAMVLLEAGTVGISRSSKREGAHLAAGSIYACWNLYLKTKICHFASPQLVKQMQNSV